MPAALHPYVGPREALAGRRLALARRKLCLWAQQVEAEDIGATDTARRIKAERQVIERRLEMIHSGEGGR